MCFASNAAYKMRYGVDPSVNTRDKTGKQITDENGVPLPQYSTPLSSGVGAQFLRPTMLGALAQQRMGFDQLRFNPNKTAAPVNAQSKTPVLGLGGVRK